MATFGGTKKHRVEDSKGNTLTRVDIEFYPTKADAEAGTNQIGTTRIDVEGDWTFETSYGEVWCKIQDYGIWKETDLSSTFGAAAVMQPGNPMREALEKYRIAPTLQPVTEQTDYYRQVVIHSGSDFYALYSTNGATYELHKSSDAGFTWAVRSTLPTVIDKAWKLKSGTILVIEPSNLSVPGGSMPRMWRSTDDGATWAQVTTGLLTGPLTAQGLTQGTDGSVLVSEYTNSNVGTTHVRRSTDDGVTWTSVLEVTNHHSHSVTYDHIAGRHVLFADDTSGGVPPEIWTSADNGATWTRLGYVTGPDQPNFVAPMYFADYIAWGSDNEINGRISRIKRSDFYAGLFDKCEQVAILNRRAIYSSFPLSADVWAVAFNGEHINSMSQDDEPGNTSCDVWLVSSNGAVVSGGLSGYYSKVQPGTLSGVRPSFPSRQFDVVEHSMFTFVNMPEGLIRPYVSVPVTAGWEPHSQRLNHRGLPVLPALTPFTIRKGSSPNDGAYLFVQPVGGATPYIAVRNDTTATTVRAELQFSDNGDLVFRSGASTAGWLRVVSGVGTFIMNKRLDMAQNSVGLRSDSFTDPNGNVTAPTGCIYIGWNGAPWYKFNGAGNTGWRPIVAAEDTPANLGSAAASINTVGKYEGRQAYDTTNDRPVWASGAGATAPWKYPDGTTAYTPA